MGGFKFHGLRLYVYIYTHIYTWFHHPLTPSGSYGTQEFEVTTERLGCYQPTEHIDNPLGYGEGEDGRNYDRRLRGPVDEKRELSIDPRTGMQLAISIFLFSGARGLTNRCAHI